MAEPLVSICCTTYNHENFIGQCLDGFLMQKTTFLIEALVHEDASTDNTARILKEYETKYPHLFRCIYQTENQFKKQNILTNILFPMAKGKYVSLCEGDDYWTDPFKLQKQVDFLEAHPDFSVSCHNVEVIGGIVQNKYVENIKEFYIAKEFASGEISLPLLSVVFRNYKLNYQDILSKTPIGDFPLILLISEYGKIKYFPEIMGVRRVHDGGLWSSTDKSAKLSALLTTIYYMIGNYREDLNKALINYHLKLVAESIKEGISIDLYPKEMLWVIKIMKYYKKIKTFFSGLGLIKPVKYISRGLKR